MGVLNQLLEPILSRHTRVPCDVRPPKAFINYEEVIKYNRKEMTFPAINHQHKVVNTHHCNIMTRGIMQSECTGERDPLQLT